MKQDSNKNYFFILGLPRSRSSWLANFFTYGNSFCYHEALRECSSINQLKELLDSNEEKNVGNSDFVLLNYIDDIFEIFPKPKILLVERNPHEVVESLLNFQLTDDYEMTEKWIDILYKKMNYIKNNYLVKTVKNYDIEDIEKTKEIWNYLLPEEKFNEKRWYFLDDLYVNVMFGKLHHRTKRDSLHVLSSKTLI